MDRLFKIEKFIEVDILQNIQDNFAKATGIGAVTVDYKGEPITKESVFTTFCNEVRKDSNFKKKCNKCDALGGVQSAITGKPHIYRCHMGLVDFAIPIILNNTYLGAILGGQIRLKEELVLEEIVKSSEWNDNSILKDYYKIVPQKSMEEINAAANLMYQMANYIVEKTFVNLMKEELNSKTEKLKEESAIRFELEKSLKQKEEENYKDETEVALINNTIDTNKKYSIEIEKAINYIEDNIKRTINLDDVANHINLSTHYLSKLFKKEMNINFITYLTERRIEVAKEMLLDPNIPIVNIAIDLSYTQPNYFSKVFKKTVGITPTEYREKYVMQGRINI